MVKKEYGTRKKYHFIYKTTNLVNQKYYFGMHSTNDLNDGYLGSGTLLRRSITKYGKENHSIEILEFLNSREELAAREREIVSLQEVVKKECMNLKPGGLGGFKDDIHRLLFLEQKKLVGNILGGRNAQKKLRSNKEEVKRRACLASKTLKEHFQNTPGHFKGRKHNPETIKFMEKARQGTGKGSNNSQFGKRWITNETESKKIQKEDLIPEGWRLGRRIK